MVPTKKESNSCYTNVENVVLHNRENTFGDNLGKEIITVIMIFTF